MVSRSHARRSPRFARRRIPDPGVTGGLPGKDRAANDLFPGVSRSLGWLFVVAWAVVCVLLAIVILALTVFA
jgi:hypothetical protein